MDTTVIKQQLLNIPVRMCRHLSTHLINSTLKEIGLDISQHHYYILKLLYDNDKMNVTEMVDLLSITKSQMTALIDKLVELNYVKRENDSVDRRKIYMMITPEGKKLVSNIDKHFEAMADESLAKLSEEELQQLESGLLILDKLCINCKNKATL